MTSANDPAILVCLCRPSGVIGEDKLRDLLERLISAGRSFTAVADLCRLVARCPGELAGALADRPVSIVACGLRAQRALLDAAEADPDRAARLLDLRSGSANQLADELLTVPSADAPLRIDPSRQVHLDGPAVTVGRILALAEAGLDVAVWTDAAPQTLSENDVAVAMTPAHTGEARRIVPADLSDAELAIAARDAMDTVEDPWVPWFPAIDRDRCVDCRKCLAFCLFGVYAESADGQVRVANPAQCKTGCPACSRVCPHAAIVFAKHDAPAINGSDVGSANPAEADLSDLTGTDVYAMLRDRTAARRLADRLGVPEEVLNSLAGPANGRVGRKGDGPADRSSR